MSVLVGAGTKLQLLDGTYQDVATVTSISGPSMSIGEIDITTLGSSTDMVKDYLPGFIDPGTIQLEALYDRSQCAALYATRRTERTWRILFTDGSRWDFTGFWSAFSSDASIDEAVGMPFTIRLTSLPTFTE
jgi:hypothetical protein